VTTLQVGSDLDPVAAGAARALALQLGVCLPLFLAALTPLLLLLAVRCSCVTCSWGGRIRTRRLLLAVDLFGLAHFTEDGQAVVKRRTPLGGALSIAALGMVVAAGLALVIGYALNNVLEQDSVLPSALQVS
jgi:hypothetical protein